VLVECVNLLWNLVEASPLALSIFNQMSLMDVVLPLLAEDSDPSLGKHQCCGSESRIRCFFTSGTGSGIGFSGFWIPDLGSRTNISESLVTIFGIKNT
jgi:hypothetical protein